MTTCNLRKFESLDRERPNRLNLVSYANRVYDKNGHDADDFRMGQLKRGIVIVSGLRMPAFTSGGVRRPEQSRNVAVQFAPSHRVEAVDEQTPGSLDVGVGDIVKVREGHLDIVDPTGRLAAIRDEHIICVIARAKDVIDPSKVDDAVPA